MNQHPASAIESSLDEGVADGKMLYDIFIFKIVNLYDQTLQVVNDFPIGTRPLILVFGHGRT